jgi:hypothetical protein
MNDFTRTARSTTDRLLSAAALGLSFVAPRSALLELRVLGLPDPEGHQMRGHLTGINASAGRRRVKKRIEQENLKCTSSSVERTPK